MKKKSLLFLFMSLMLVALILSSCSNAPKSIAEIIKNVQPFPANGETISSSSVTLQWKVNVPASLSVTYSLYFAPNGESLTLMATGLTRQSYTVKGLKLGKAYSWRIVARDSKGHVVNGPLWQFVYRKAITYALIGDITTLNPWKPKNANDHFIQNSLNASLYRTIYKTGEVVPYLAKDMWKVLKERDNYTITLHLLKGLKWSDGSNFTSDDVVFTYQTALKNNFWNVKSYSLIKVEKTGKYTVKFYMKNASLRNILPLFKCPIMEKSFWKDEKYSTFTYGTFPSMGPFIVKKWEKDKDVEVTQNPFYPFKGERITLYKNGAVNISSKTLGINDTYYGLPTRKADLSFYEGPHVTTITYKLFKTQSQAANNLAEGKLNFILTPNGLSRAIAQTVVSEKDKSNVRTVQNQSEGFRYISFNMRRYPMSNKTFRVAIAYLVDQKALSKILTLNNAVLPAYSVVQSENMFWHDPNTKAYGQGMTMTQRYEWAIKTLKEGGFTWQATPIIKDGKLVSKGKGLKGPDGKLIKKIKLLAPSAGYDSLRAAAALWIERWANDLGIPIVADLTGFDKIVKTVWNGNHNFDIYMLGWIISPYPDYLKDFFYSKAHDNTSGYNNAEFDKIADEFTSQTSMLQARKYAYELQEILARDVPYVTLFTLPVIEAYRGIDFPYTQLYGGIEEANGFPSFVRLK